MFNHEGLKFELTDLPKTFKIMKNYKLGFHFLYKSISLIFISCLFFFSCQQYEIEQIEPDISPFLSINGDLENPSTFMIPENIKIYREAFERVLATTVQNGKSVEFKFDKGSEINISEDIFLRITENLSELINSEKMIIVKVDGENTLISKKPINSIRRLKSGGMEEDSYFRWRLDGNIPLDIMNGMRSYNSNIHSNINDIWDLSTGNFPAYNYYTMSGNFTYNGETYSYFMGNGCANSGTGNNGCSWNDISSHYTDQQSGGNYYFILEGAATQQPIVVIHAYSNTGYSKMKNFLGW
jgi:hypothetical protein